MKTLSQNTTSSACAPETDLQKLVATPVPDERRISFWPQHFGLIPLRIFMKGDHSITSIEIG